MKDAPFVAARKRLQAVLDELNPAGGKVESDPPQSKKRAKKKAK